MARTYFLWDPLSDNILQERDESGAVTAEYTAEPGLYGNIISQNKGGVESQFHYDAQGSTLAVTDDNQNVIDTFAYTAFGEVTERTGTTEVPFQYIGQKGYYTDGLSGQITVRERPYEPVRARWVAPDPLGMNRNNASTYCYIKNSPLTGVDPSGLSFLPDQPLPGDGGWAPWAHLFTPQVQILVNARGRSACGGAEFKVKWNIPPEILKLGPGVVIQELDDSFDVTDCCGEPVPLYEELESPVWEAWSYSPATIATDRLDDNFRTPDWGNKTKGTVIFTGKVIGLAKYTLPGDFRRTRRSPYGILPHTKQKPPGWPKEGLLHHELKAEWDCCVTPRRWTEATGIPND
jgi:RHS repeat-associated protein